MRQDEQTRQGEWGRSVARAWQAMDAIRGAIDHLQKVEPWRPRRVLAELTLCLDEARDAHRAAWNAESEAEAASAAKWARYTEGKALTVHPFAIYPSGRDRDGRRVVWQPDMRELGYVDCSHAPEVESLVTGWLQALRHLPTKRVVFRDFRDRPGTETERSEIYTLEEVLKGKVDDLPFPEQVMAWVRHYPKREAVEVARALEADVEVVRAALEELVEDRRLAHVGRPSAEWPARYEVPAV